MMDMNYAVFERFENPVVGHGSEYGIHSYAMSLNLCVPIDA
jgi:hypothetical protein